MEIGALSAEERKDLASQYNLPYKKIYKLEWDFKSTSHHFSEVIHGYPDCEAMNKVLNKFKQRKEANKRHKPMLLFRVTRNI
jgi:hypothetical protein